MKKIIIFCLLLFCSISLWSGPSLYGDKYIPIFEIEIKERNNDDVQKEVVQLLNSIENAFSNKTSKVSTNTNKYRILISKEIYIDDEKSFIIKAEAHANKSSFFFKKSKLNWIIALSYSFNCWYPDENTVVNINLEERNLFLSLFKKIDEYIISYSKNSDILIKNIRKEPKIY